MDPTSENAVLLQHVLQNSSAIYAKAGGTVLAAALRLSNPFKEEL
jgi:hypothetical protein